MEKKPKILQVKAPTKWDILKTKAKYVERYLKGSIIKGTEVKGAARIPTIHTSKFDNEVFLKKHQIRRKKINKLKYKSRRKNRSGI